MTKQLLELTSWACELDGFHLSENKTPFVKEIEKLIEMGEKYKKFTTKKEKKKWELIFEKQKGIKVEIKFEDKIHIQTQSLWNMIEELIEEQKEAQYG